jgi:hypothetical protein
LGFPAPESFSSPRDATKGSSPAAGTRLHPCSLAFQNDERNRITPAVRLKGHSARLPGGLLALASVTGHVRPDSSRPWINSRGQRHDGGRYIRSSSDPVTLRQKPVTQHLTPAAQDWLARN